MTFYNVQKESAENHVNSIGQKDPRLSIPDDDDLMYFNEPEHK